MRPYLRGTEHLVFEMQEESLLRWKAFLETGELGEKEPFEDPGEFCVDRENYRLLEQAVEGKRQKTGMPGICSASDTMWMTDEAMLSKRLKNLSNWKKTLGRRTGRPRLC